MPAPSELPPPVPPREEVRRAAEEILSRPEFRQPPRSLYDIVTDWIGDQLERLVETAFDGSPLVTVVALAILASIVGLLGWRVARTVRADPVRRDATTVRTEVRRAPEDWNAQADEHGRSGRWRDALRCRYRALVASLGRRGVLEEIPGRTAGEYRHAVERSLSAAAPAFDEATDLFEQVWYGGADAGPGDDTRLRGLSTQVLEAASR